MCSNFFAAEYSDFVLKILVFCRKNRDRERERERQDSRRDKRPEKVLSDKIVAPPETQKSTKDRNDAIHREAEKEAVEDSKKDKNPITPLVANAEQWVDPWMRRQPQQNRSPELRSPERKPLVEDNISSIGSSDSEGGTDIILKSFHFIFISFI